MFTLPCVEQDGRFFDTYEFTSEEPIGHGTYSICMKCKHIKTHKTYAVKILKSSHNAKTEIDALEMCRGHSNIVELIEVITDDEYTYIVTEYLEGPELFAYVQKNPLSETEARHLFKEIVKAVQHMHSKRIVHRDLKLENILFTHESTSTLKLIDFGFATRISKRLDTTCYTLEYAAPEILSNKKYNEACDLWSLGAILYALLCGHTPFQRRNESHDDHDIRERIKRGALDTDSSAWQSLNKSAKDLIRSLLTVCPSKRMKLSNIFDSGWFDAPVNSHSSATEIIEPAAIDRQTFIDEHMPTTLVSTSTDTIVVATTTSVAPLAKSHSSSSISINSLSESGATSELGLSKSSSGIGLMSDNFNRSISIDSTASTVRNDLIPDQDNLDDSKEILVSTVASYLNDLRYDPIESTESEHQMDTDIPTEVISDSDSELCINANGEFQELSGFERGSESILRHVQHALDLEKVLLYEDADILLPCPGREIKPESEWLQTKRYQRDSIQKRRYSNSSDERWFDGPGIKLAKVEQMCEDSDSTAVRKPKRLTRSSKRHQEIH